MQADSVSFLSTEGGVGHSCCLLRWRKLEENLWGNVTSNLQLCPRGSPRAGPLIQRSDASLCLFGQPPASACLPLLKHHLQNALEKAMGRGAWQVTVHRAARSRTRPSEHTRTLNRKRCSHACSPPPSPSICCDPQGSGLQPRARGDLPVLPPSPTARSGYLRAPLPHCLALQLGLLLHRNPGPPARLHQPLVRTSCWVSALSSPIPGGTGSASSANTSGLIRRRDRNICLQKTKETAALL